MEEGVKRNMVFIFLMMVLFHTSLMLSYSLNRINDLYPKHIFLVNFAFAVFDMFVLLNGMIYIYNNIDKFS